ncbi:MAG TPA: hypothetical protein VN213_00650 [Solirubrobacteraceae bacterium]|nr:hypothetical protein [Solirubrobacteraceae bacterium]
MSQISPPIRIVLVVAVAFMAAWTLFLRPKAETVEPAPAPAVTQTTPVATATTAKAATEAPEAGTTASLPKPVRAAIEDGKVLVLMFWTPGAADDRAVRRELAAVDRHAGDVVVHSAPVGRIARYQQITRGADVAQSPTILVVDRDRKVETLVGYADHLSVDQLVTDALRNS